MAGRWAHCSARLRQKQSERLYAPRVAHEYYLGTRCGLLDVRYGPVRWEKNMCVQELYWHRKARCCVLHCPHWKLETVASRLVEETHLYRRSSVSESSSLHHTDILIAFGLPDCANHSVLRTRDARHPGERDATAYLPLPAFLTSNRGTRAAHRHSGGVALSMEHRVLMMVDGGNAYRLLPRKSRCTLRQDQRTEVVRFVHDQTCVP